MGMLHGDFEVIEGTAAGTAQSEIALTHRWNPKMRHAAGRPRRRPSYTMVSGDTLRGVAAKLFHDAKRWRDIAAANPGLDARRLRPGQVIKLPELIGAGERDP